MRFKGVPIDDISMFNTPQIYFELAIYLLKDCLSWAKQALVSHLIPIIITLLVWILIATIPIFDMIYYFIIFALYWIILGVASSIGLGTGLHTFILYLGPHIARVALNATLCGKVPPMLPSRWNFDHFGECQNSDQENIGFLGILWAVQLESFLWGFGTAIGQLPPYFVAKKAAQTRFELKKMQQQAEERMIQEQQLVVQENSGEDQSNVVLQNQKKLHEDMPLDEIEQMIELRKKADLTLVERIKLFIYNNMQKYGFWAILVCASIPNPLFDLAGITSGHFRIPFKTFFSATVIVHIQMLFIIAIFRKQTLNMLLQFIESINKNLASSLNRTLQSKKKQFNQPKTFKENKSFIGAIWDLFITGMVLFFLKSIMDAYIKQKAITLRDN